MSWAVGYDSNWKRDIGYGVPAHCDHPECDRKIDRGIGYVCGGDVYGGEDGCGLHFCGHHLSAAGPFCARCSQGKEPFEPKPDHPEWLEWKLTDESWQKWRDENPEAVETARAMRGTA
jgi:hypothetical protein